MSATSVNTAKPKLNFWQIWNMSFGFLGIQFGFELQNSNVSRIFETLGANKDDIPILWIAAPLTGLIVQPMIGYISDRTWHPFWGRRRPFFFIGAILATIALLIMPNSPSLWVAGGMLWILDASINISMEPFRAFVGDKLSPQQRTAGFAMQSFFIGTGSVIAALLPWIFKNWFDMSNTAASGTIPDSVKWSFYTGAFAFLTAVMYTVFTTKEFPPESIEKLKAENKNASFKDGLKETVQGIFNMPKAMRQLALVQFFTWFALFSMWIYSTNAVTNTLYDMKISRELYTKLNGHLQAEPTNPSNEKELNSLKSDIQEIDRFQTGHENVTLTINLTNYFLAGKNLVSADRQLLKKVQQQYNDGADWLGVCSSVRNGVAAIFAFIIPLIAMRVGRKKTHTICLTIGGIGLISLNLITASWAIAISMGLVGIAWASILSMPYAILSGSLPANKMGYYMGIFNFFIVIPQIMAATILGFLTMHVFSGNTMLTLVLGGVMMIVAGILSLWVEDKDEVTA
jgi:maltose/moltooligosaccharide transporter